MRKKSLIIIMCLSMSAALFAGCSNTDVVNTSAVVEEGDNEQTSEVTEQDLPEEKEPAEETEQTVDAQETDNTAEEDQDIPRSDAYEMFLNGEMDVTVVNSELMKYPESGTYSYEELLGVANTLLFGQEETELNVKYSIFTPSGAGEGEDVLALLIENPDPGYLSWIGFIGYNDGKLEMKYCRDYGYRAYLEVYNTGEILSGGSGGAGATYNDYMIILPDSSAQVIYKSATLYSTWCNELFYTLGAGVDYSSLPALPDTSILKVIEVEKEENVYIWPSQWSEDEDIKTQEDSFVSKLEELGAIVTDEATVTEMLVTGIDQNNVMTWMDKETITVRMK